MMKLAAVSVLVCPGGALAGQAAAQEISARSDEVTASDWNLALEKSGGTAILPIGILEKAE